MTKRRKFPRLGPARACLLAIYARCVTTSLTAFAGVNVVEVIPCDQARQHIGETTTVCGLVVSGVDIDTPGRERTYLNFDRPYPNQTFAVEIPESVRSRFSEAPETLFKGKTICVTGPIIAYRGKPEIVVEDPSQIVIQGEAPTPRETSDDTKPSVPAPPAPVDTPKPAAPAPLAGVASVNAQKHVGETTTVCGLVASARYFNSASSKPTILNFDRPYPNHTFSVVVPGSARGRFKESPERLFSGKTVCVTGQIVDYRGKPEIVVENPSQIAIQD
jgi:micrococcal nuclease